MTEKDGEKDWLETFDKDQELTIHVFGGGE